MNCDDDRMLSRPISSIKPKLNVNLVSEEEMAELERKEREKTKKDAYKKSGVGERYLNLTLDDFKANTSEQKKALECVRDFIKAVNNKENRSLLLIGRPGTGKTMLAAMIIKECGGCYRKSYQLVNEARRADSYNSSEDRNDMIKRYAGYRLLVIDEVGKDNSRADEEWNLLWQIINERYENELPIVIVSNLAKNELAGYLGQHIVDRLNETCKTIEFTGQSFRPNL